MNKEYYLNDNLQDFNKNFIEPYRALKHKYSGKISEKELFEKISYIKMVYINIDNNKDNETPYYRFKILGRDSRGFHAVYLYGCDECRYNIKHTILYYDNNYRLEGDILVGDKMNNKYESLRLRQTQLDYLESIGNPNLIIVKQEFGINACTNCVFKDVRDKHYSENGAGMFCKCNPGCIFQMELSSIEDLDDDIKISKTKLREILDDVINLGMYTRENQLCHRYTESGNNVLEAYIKKHNVFGENK